MEDIQKISNDFGHNFIAEISKELEQEESAATNYGVKVIKTIEIILGGGGPAMKIMYTPETNEQYGNVEILYQDWGTPWTPAELSYEQYNQLWTYCERYYPEDLIEL